MVEVDEVEASDPPLSDSKTSVGVRHSSVSFSQLVYMYCSLFSTPEKKNNKIFQTEIQESSSASATCAHLAARCPSPSSSTILRLRAYSRGHQKKDLMKANLMVVWENLPLYHFKPYGSVASASCSARNCLQKATSALSRSSNFCQSSSVGEGSWEMIGQIRILDNLRVGEEHKKKVYIFIYIYINIGQYQYIYCT